MADEDRVEETDDLNEGELNSAFVDALGSGDSAGSEGESQGDPSANTEPAEPEGTGQDDAVAPVQEAQGEAVASEADEGEGDDAPESNLESLLQTAREYGISIDGVRNEAELSERVLGQIRRMQGILAQQRQSEQQRQQPPQEPVQQDSGEEEWDPRSHFKTKYGGPEWKEEYNQAINSGVIQRDEETGLWRAARGFEAIAGPMAEEVNAAQQHAAQFWQGLTRGNPYENIYSAIADPIERMVQDRVEQLLEQKFEQAQKQSAVSRFESENQSWMYQTDPDTGTRVLSSDGQRFVDTVSELRGSGIEDPATLIKLAQKYTGLGGATPAAAQQAAVQQAAAQSSPPKQSEATGAKAPAAKTQEAQQQSFLENAQRIAQHSPSARGRASEDGPQVMTEGDLESFFIRSQREAAAL